MSKLLSFVCLLVFFPVTPAFSADLTAEEVRQTLAAAEPNKPTDLSGKSLEGLDLSGVDFKRANLARTNLFGAKLVGANLTGAILSGANLDDLGDFVQAVIGDGLLRQMQAGRDA